MEHPVTIGIKADSKAQALEVAKALIDIKNALSDSDLLDLAKLLKQNPSIVSTAKKFLK